MSQSLVHAFMRCLIITEILVGCPFAIHFNLKTENEITIKMQYWLLSDSETLIVVTVYIKVRACQVDWEAWPEGSRVIGAHKPYKL